MVRVSLLVRGPGRSDADRVLGAPGGRYRKLIPRLPCQHKRDTLRTTKYVELVIVADNREVRASRQSWVRPAANKENGKERV